MKTLFLLMTTFFTVVSLCQAQNVQTVPSGIDGKGKKVITYDFLNPIKPQVQTIKAKQNMELKIINFNPYIFDIKIDDSTAVYPNQKPEGFDEIFTPDLKKVEKSAPPADSAKVASGSLPQKAKEKLKLQIGEINAFLSSYRSAEISAKDILNYAQMGPELERLVYNCSLNFTDLKSTTDAYVNSILGPDATKVPNTIVTVITSKIPPVRTKLIALVEQGSALKAKYSAELENANIAKLSEYKQLQADIAKRIATIDVPLDNVKKLLEKLDLFEQTNVAGKIADNYDKVMSSRVEIIHSLAPGFNDDELIYKVKITKRKEVFCGIGVTDFKLEGLVVGGTKIDFSTGIVANIGNKKFFDQTYRKDPYYTKKNALSTDSITIARNRNNNVIVPSIAAFMNIYSRISTSINVGGVFGASVGTDQRLYWHLGGSVIIGKSARWIIGSGVSVAKSNTLDGRYHEGQTLKMSEFTGEIPVDNAYRLGGFLSVTYNLKLIP